MRHLFAYITIFAALPITLIGCSEEQSAEFDRIVTSTLLSATWSSECVIDGVNSYLPVLTFTSFTGNLYDSGTGTSSNIFHTDNTTCSSIAPETVDINTFSYKLGADVVLDGSIAELTEAIELDTTNTTEGSADIGAMEFDILSIKDKFTLYFGDKSDPTNGSTADLRPTQLSDTIIFTR